MKALKIFGIIAALLIVLLLAAIVILPMVIDPNDYRDDITAITKEKTGLDLSLEGDLSLSVFPWLGVRTERIKLAQPAAIKVEGKLLDVGEANIKVKVLPLLGKKVEVSEILLREPNIHLVVDKTGTNSIDYILQSLQGDDTQQEQTKTAVNTNTSDDSAPSSLNALVIAGINIINGQVRYDDQQANSRYQISDLNINSGNLLSGKATPLSISGKALINGEQATQFSLQSQASIDTDTLAVALNTVDFSITQESMSINGDITSLDFQQTQQQLNINAVTVAASMQDLAATLNIPTITADLVQESVNIPSINVEAMGAVLSGNTQVRNWSKNLTVVGLLKSNSFNLKKIIQQLQIDYQPTASSALEKFSFDTEFNASTNGVALKMLAFNVDDSSLKGDASIVNFDKPKYRFDLSLDQFNLDNYLPASSTSNSTDSTSSSSASESVSISEAMLAPLALFENLNANGVFRAGKLQASGATLTDTVIKIASANKSVTITPSAKLYGGSIAGKINYKNISKPTLSIVSKLANINLEPLLTNVDITDQFSGIATINTDVTIINNNGKASNKGTISLQAKDGAIKGVDIKKIIDDAKNKYNEIRGKAVTPSTTDNNTEETKFAAMSATLLLNDNIINNNDLSIKAPAFRVAGKGKVDIEQQTLDYLTSVVVVNTSKGQGGADVDSLKGVTIPVRFYDSLLEPKYKIDTRALVKANTAKAVAEKKDKLKGKLLNKLGVETTEGESEKEQKEKAKEELKKKLLDKLFK